MPVPDLALVIPPGTRVAPCCAPPGSPEVSDLAMAGAGHWIGLADLPSGGSALLGRRLVRGTRLEPPSVPPQPVIQLHGRSGLTPLSQCAFPDDCDPPAQIEQIESVPPIAFDIRLELRPPELLASGRGIGVGAIGVPMPEAAMHEAHGSEASKHEVRAARKLPIVQAVSEAASMNSPSKDELRSRVPASDPGHHARTGRSVHYVRHRRCFWGAEEYMRERISRQKPRMIKAGGCLDCRSGERRSAIRSCCPARAEGRSRSLQRTRAGGTGLPVAIAPGLRLLSPPLRSGS